MCRYRCENNVPFAQARAAFDKPTDAQAVPEAQAAPEVVGSSPEHPQRRRHSRRRQVQQNCADKSTSSPLPGTSSAVNIDPGTTSVPVSSVNKNEKRSFKDVLCSSPRSSAPQVQMRPTPKPAQDLPADTAPENADSRPPQIFSGPSSFSSIVRQIFIAVREFLPLIKYSWAGKLLHFIGLIEPLIESFLR